MAVFNGVVHLTHQDSGTDQTLWHTTYDGKNWPSDTLIPDVYLNESPGWPYSRRTCMWRIKVPTLKVLHTGFCYTVFDGKGLVEGLYDSHWRNEWFALDGCFRRRSLPVCSR